MQTTFAPLAAEIKVASVFLHDLPLCQVRLMNDARFPWLILIPRRSRIEEWHELDVADAIQLAKDIRAAAQALHQYVHPDKINIASLGNVIRQLHVHVIARTSDDVAWPRTVWERGDRVPYSESEAHSTAMRIAEQLECLGSTTP